MRFFSAATVLCFTLTAIALAGPAIAQDPPGPAPVRATVNGEPITAEALEARQYDLIGKDTIVSRVLAEDQQLTHMPSVKQDLKGLMAAVVQEKPDASKEEILATVEQRAAVYTQTLAVRRVKPKLFADVEKQALDQLIDEQLMLQAAKAEGVTVAEADIDKAMTAVGKRAGADGETLHKLLVAWDKRALPGARARATAELAWKLVLDKSGGANAAAAKLEALRQAAKIERN